MNPRLRLGRDRLLLTSGAIVGAAAADNDPANPTSTGERFASIYEINMLRCIFCGLCEEACPKDAIYLSETFTPSNYTRKSFIYGKKDLLIPDPVTQPEEYAKARGENSPRV